MPANTQRAKKEVQEKAGRPAQSVGGYLLDRLQSYGIQHIFGVPGDYVLRMDKLIEEHAIQFINTTRENTAGYMADAYARIRGLGVACITFGVGINIVNAMAQAFVESSPLVVISGAAGIQEFKTHPLRHHLINSVPGIGGDDTQLELFRPILVDYAILRDPSKAAAEIDRVLASCLFHSKPVYIEIPRDLIEAPIEPPSSSCEYQPLVSDPEALKEALEEVFKILKESSSPIIWAGHELQRFHLTDPLLQFAETYRIPIVSTLLGKTVISEFHPLFVGIYQGAMGNPQVSAFVEEECDCIIGLGALLTDTNTGIFTTKLDQTRQIWASNNSIKIGHHHYPHVTFQDFIKGLAHSNLSLRFRVDYPACIDRLPHHYAPHKGKKTTVQRVFESLQHHLKPEHILIADVGDSLFGSSDLVLEKDSFFASAYFGSLGFAIPAAIAFQLATPKRRPVVLVGDGAFQMTCTELSTAVWNHLDPIIIVLNNHGYGTERPLLEGAYNDILDWNYAELPKLLNGGYGIRVATEEAFDQALLEALQRRGVFSLIEVELDKLDFSSALKRLGALSQQKRNNSRSAC